MNKPATSVHRIHFEDLDGSEFERLVFAYHWRSDDWRSLGWYGQAGSDLGRDIWGVRENAANNGESVCIQCVNRKNLTFAKIAKDIDKVLKAPNGVPDRFRVVTQSKISAKMRDKIKAHVTSLGVKECDTWSGPEFEEFLRHGSKDVLPAILVTTRHPSTFRESFEPKRSKRETEDALLLIPLRKVCKSAEDVVDLIQKVFEDIKEKKQLSTFLAAKRMRQGVAGALVDAVILQPKIGGIGFDLKKFFSGVKEN